MKSGSSSTTSAGSSPATIEQKTQSMGSGSHVVGDRGLQHGAAQRRGGGVLFGFGRFS